MSDMIDLKSLENKAGQLVDAAKKAGADACDVSVVLGQSLSVSVRDGKVENTDRSEGDGFSLRVFVGNRVASVSSNQNDDAAMLAERAVQMARVSTEDPYQGLVSGDELVSDIPALDLFDGSICESADLEARALASEAAGLEVQGVDKSMGAGASWGISGLVLATSEGFSGSYMRSRHSVSSSMVSGTGTGMERDYDFASAVYLEDLKSPGEIGRSAGERVVRRSNPRQVKSANVPIVFDRRVSTGLIGALSGAINGASIARKTSFLREKMGKAVAAKGITLVDNPLRDRGLGAKPFDGEGRPVDAIRFVEDGVLQDWILDGATARELGLQSNSRAARSGSGTTPSLTDCHFLPGEMSFDEMIASIDNGLYLTETIGHGINMVTGDYSKGASGFWIENGEIAYPVAEITIAGNLADIFLNMTPANDLEFKYASNAPTMLVEGMTVGGK